MLTVTVDFVQSSGDITAPGPSLTDGQRSSTTLTTRNKLEPQRQALLVQALAISQIANLSYSDTADVLRPKPHDSSFTMTDREEINSFAQTLPHSNSARIHQTEGESWGNFCSS